MSIELNHTIVPSSDKIVTSSFYSRIFGFECIGRVSNFYVIKVNNTLTLDFKDSNEFTVNHYAFKVEDNDFDNIYSKIKEEEIIYGSDPYDLENMQINNWHGGRGLYFRDPNGHVLEILTRTENDQIHGSNY